MAQNLISIKNLTKDQVASILDAATKYKKGGGNNNILNGKTIALLFLNQSLRTRISFENAIRQLGGSFTTIDAGNTSYRIEWRKGVCMDGDKPEHIIDAGKVLEQYFDAICIRSFPELKDLETDISDPALKLLSETVSIPVINMESCVSHPSQALADLFTIHETFGAIEKQKISVVWTYHPKRLPLAVPLSFVDAATLAGGNVTIAAPEEYQIPDSLLSVPDSVKRVTDPYELDKDTKIIYAKSWASPTFYNEPEKDMEARKQYRGRTIDKQLCNKFKDVKVMHCMPFRRNVVISDDVADSDINIMYTQAGNRLHVNKAIFDFVFGSSV